MSNTNNIKKKHNSRGKAGEVFWAFFKLGMTSFGGPIAHLGFFRDEFVTRRKWLSDEAYADLVVLCQFLPGPASSQVGFALGLMRAGWFGAISAFAAFTLPSAAALFLFAITATQLSIVMESGALDGLKIAAVAIVAQAVWGMGKTLCPDRQRVIIALAATVTALIFPGLQGILGAIVLGITLGSFFCRSGEYQVSIEISPRIRPLIGILSLSLFCIFFAGLPLIAAHHQSVAFFESFYRAGSLVFGGGHVVLPTLEAEVVQRGWLSLDEFIAGYGAAQAIPGPLFTFAAYLGAITQFGPQGFEGAMTALVAIFLPGFLLLVGVLPFWNNLRQLPWAQSAIRGTNAAIVGVLLSALYSPVFISAVRDGLELGLAIASIVFLMVWKLPPWSIVLFASLGGVFIKWLT